MVKKIIAAVGVALMALVSPTLRIRDLRTPVFMRVRPEALRFPTAPGRFG